MAAPKRAPHTGAVAEQGELTELLRLETLLAERLASLELEVERIRAEAEGRRAGVEAAAGARLEKELAAQSARLDAELQDRIRQIALTATEEARRLRAIDDASLDALAERAAERVLAAAMEERVS